MKYNEGYPSDIVALVPHGTNSTFFTNCCDTAICDDEARCPRCSRILIGHDLSPGHERRMARWRNATRFWQRTA